MEGSQAVIETVLKKLSRLILINPKYSTDRKRKGYEGRRRSKPVRNAVEYETPQEPDPKGYANIKKIFCIFAPQWQIRIL